MFSLWMLVHALPLNMLVCLCLIACDRSVNLIPNDSPAGFTHIFLDKKHMPTIQFPGEDFLVHHNKTLHSGLASVSYFPGERL